MIRPPRSLRFAALLAGAALSIAPLSAQTARNISASDKATGAKANPELVAEFGGAVSGPQAAYVASVGKNIAIQSGLSNARDDFTVTLLNSPVNNAFAIPGGYVYTTRQLVALMNMLNGDLCYANLNPTVQPTVWADFGNNNQASAAFRPWMPCPGNHEITIDLRIVAADEIATPHQGNHVVEESTDVGVVQSLGGGRVAVRMCD